MRVLAVVPPDARIDMESGGGIEFIQVTPDAAAVEVRSGTYDAVVVYARGPGDADAASALLSSSVPAIVVLEAPDPLLMRALFRSGARDVLIAPSTEELSSAIRSIPAPAPQKSGSTGGIVAVISAQGGVGRSTVALNLSLLLAESGSTILVDMVPFYGILHILADLEPSVTLADILGAPVSGREAVASALIPYEGIRLLAAPPSPDGFRPEPAAVDDLLGTLLAMADYVVVDTERLLLPYTLTVLERAHLVLCLVRMTVPSLRNLKAYLQSFVHQHLPVQKVLIVGVAGHGAVSSRQAEEIVGVELAHILPLDPVAVSAENAGVPVVLGAPRSRLARSLVQLSGVVTGRLAVPESAEAR